MPRRKMVLLYIRTHIIMLPRGNKDRCSPVSHLGCLGCDKVTLFVNSKQIKCCLPLHAYFWLKNTYLFCTVFFSVTNLRMCLVILSQILLKANEVLL